LSHFTRKRVMDFPTVFLLILRKSVKSLQLVLNELFMQGKLTSTVTASAYTQARKKLKHTAFIELNNNIVDIYYSDNNIKTWRGFRCLGCDGSKIILPDAPEIADAFGRIKIKNQHGCYDDFTQGICMAFYDVLNHITVKSTLAHGGSYEVELAKQLLEDLDPHNLLIFDRGFVSYEFFATLLNKNQEFVIRCKQNSFKKIQHLFRNEGEWSQILTLEAPKEQRKILEEKGLPLQIQLRFVSVILSTGEIEVLATTLMDETIKRDDFQALYYLRWGVEGFFNIVKGRLGLENFTGKTAESVRQDFWSTIFISNLESIVTEEIEEKINQDKPAENLIKKVNKAVSFNAIKNMAFDIFLSEKDSMKSLEKLNIIFKMNTIVVRPERNPLRKKASPRKLYTFLKRRKKQVF
jgi:hypothetical protein